MNEAAAYGWEKRGWTGPNLSEGIARIYVESKLPTPTTRDHKDGTSEHERNGVVQTDTVARAVFNSGEVKLPTPTAVDGNTVAKSELDNDDPKHRLKVAAQVLARDGISWGKFEPAIRRWEETLGRPAPAPTQPDGKDGAHRLSAHFTEWMMGVPFGWITDCGLTRNESLKACGNGVVPQQAELALRVLLQGLDLNKEKEKNEAV
jgi:DNA (cytosine-5)-methyltransferase 1